MVRPASGVLRWPSLTERAPTSRPHEAASGTASCCSPSKRRRCRQIRSTLPSEVVASLTRARLFRLHGEQFAHGDLSVAVVGDVDAGHARDVAADVFGGWNAPPPPPIALGRVAPATRRQRLVVPMMNKAQADI